MQDSVGWILSFTELKYMLDDAKSNDAIQSIIHNETICAKQKYVDLSSSV